MTHSSTTTDPGLSAPTPWSRALGVAVVLSLVVGVILLLFAWPAVTASPQNLPVGVVGDVRHEALRGHHGGFGRNRGQERVGLPMAFVVLGLGTVFSGLVMRREPTSGLSSPVLPALKILVIPVALGVAVAGAVLLTSAAFVGTRPRPGPVRVVSARGFGVAW